MLVAHRPADVPYEKNSVVSVGSFDGVHRAHQQVIREVVRRAAARGGRSVIVTFDPHPKQVLHSSQEIRLLSTLEERRRISEDLGVEVFFVIEFTYEFSRQSFREFYEKYIVHGTGVSEVVEGYDHHFGRDREGSVRELRQMGTELDFSVVTVEPVSMDGEVVNSTAIRHHLQQGNVERAAELLGWPYGIEGAVVHGDGRGRQLGFPTANIAPLDAAKMIPANGVYVARVNWEGQVAYGLVNVGIRPTFGASGARTMETYVLEYEGDLYGRRLSVEFLRRLRDETKFDSAEALVRQMNIDKEQGLTIVREYQKTSSVPRDREASKNQKSHH